MNKITNANAFLLLDVIYVTRKARVIAAKDKCMCMCPVFVKIFSLNESLEHVVFKNSLCVKAFRFCNVKYFFFYSVSTIEM